MEKNTAKLNMLRKEIESSSDKEAAAIIDNAEASVSEMLGKLEKKLLSEQEGNIRRITEAFKTSERKRVSEVRYEEGKRVLSYRNELVDALFDEIREMLIKSVDTPEYDKYLKNAVEKASGVISLKENTKVFCKLSHTEAVKSALGINCNVLESNSIDIGGIIFECAETGIIIDLSLDAALENEREKFSSLKEMQI